MMAAMVRPRGVVRWISVGLIVSVALFLAMPVASATGLGSHPLGSPERAPPAVPAITNPLATWDSTNLGAASDQAHAFSITTNQRVLVNFTFVVPVGEPKVTTARIQAIYFGAVISTDQVSASTDLSGNGVAYMNWTLGTFTYLLAGVYLLTASLVNATGATVWSENFYIQAHAPYRIGSGLIVFLLVLGFVELYSILTVGRAMRKRPKPGGGAPPTPWQQPATTAEPGAGGAAPA
ncbi:MAG: hypothetical protein WAK40_00155, partial [Thermoplasmata archaeon]